MQGKPQGGTCCSLLNGVINAQVVTVVQSTVHSDISKALQTLGSYIHVSFGLFWQQQEWGWVFGKQCGISETSL